MKDYLYNQKKVKLEKFQELILEDTNDYDSLTILCLGKYNENLSPYLTFATKVGTILKVNQFQVYGDQDHSILIDKENILNTLLEIKENHPHTFILVVMNSYSDSKKMLGNLSYSYGSFFHNDFEVGNATLMFCGSYGNNEEEYKKNSLSREEINICATEVSLLLMQILSQKEEKVKTLKLHHP